MAIVEAVGLRPEGFVMILLDLKFQGFLRFVLIGDKANFCVGLLLTPFVPRLSFMENFFYDAWTLMQGLDLLKRVYGQYGRSPTTFIDLIEDKTQTFCSTVCNAFVCKTGNVRGSP